MTGGTEPFPQLHQLKPLNGHDYKTRPRRKSSGLGGEIRAGDTGAPAVATLDMTPMSPGVSRTDEERKKPYSKKRKAKTFVRRLKAYALKRTWVVPLVILGIFGTLYAVNPTETNPIHYFIFLSYKRPIPLGSPPGTVHQYGKGVWDFAFVAFYTVVLSFTREFIMQKFLRPLARSVGLKTRSKQSRFMEQMYTAIYFGFLGPAGIYVMSRTPVWYFNTRGMYEDYPHKTHEAVFKFYYLFQAAYWAQQAIVLVLGVEKPRKDYKELVAHHILSLSLIWLSYRFHFTYMGIAVFITHDISDFFLATSKSLNYIDHPIVGPYFALFICVWIYLRHYLNIRILISEFTEFKTVGPYGLSWEDEQYKGLTAHVISTGLLGSLQLLNLFWLYYIFRIAWRYVVSNVVEDERSDDEGDRDEDEELTKLNAEGVDEVAAPRLLVNGHPMNGKATGAQVKTDGVTNRKTVA